MGHQSQPDNSANAALNQELAEQQQQEYDAQQQAWQQEHSLIQAQGGLNWTSQNPNASQTNSPSSSTPSEPHNANGILPAPTPTPNAPKPALTSGQANAKGVI